MSKNYTTSLFIFRRDLRLNDNTALIEACDQSERVVPCFFFDPRQVERNPYRSDHAIAFMCDALSDLDARLERRGSRLSTYLGRADDMLPGIVKRLGAHAIFVNADYTPFSARRDRDLHKLCGELGIALVAYDDTALHPPGAVLKDDGDPYTVFTPYFKKASQHPVRAPRQFNFRNLSSDEKATAAETAIAHMPAADKTGELAVRGGRTEALKHMARATALVDYKKDREIPALNATTQLSAYLKFGCISPREVFDGIRDALGESHELIRQLHWRDFYYQIAHFHPRVFGAAFQKKFDAVAWRNNRKEFKAWQKGQTGFPIVDAGMRELAQTGYMHNRVRMIVASFLTKDLLIDWRWGEKHFAKLLVDYDPCVNNGNWQWAASTGCDAQPYFRIFSPWLQQKKFDNDAGYIKRWVPELKDLPPAQIHKLDQGPMLGVDYPQPIVDHKERAADAKAAFEQAGRETS